MGAVGNGGLRGARAGASIRKGETHRVDPDCGSTLTFSNRDSQSNCWVNWKIMGQPCEFQVGEPCEDFAARRTSWLAAYRQALKRRAAASASVNDGIPAQPTPWGSGGGRGGDDQDAEAARPGATCPREKDTKLAQKLG